MRWGFFLILVLLIATVLALLPSLAGTPDPGAQCDSGAVFQDQLARAGAFGQWVFRQLSILAILVGSAAFAAFYLQIFHSSLGVWGTLARLSLVLVLGLAAGWQLLGVAERWVLRQRTTDGPSCLLEALNTNASQKASALTGQWFVPPPDHWLLAARVDMTILVILGVLFGTTLYSLVRRLRRL